MKLVHSILCTLLIICNVYAKEGEKLYVIGDVVNIRSEPSIQSTVVKQCQRFEEIICVSDRTVPDYIDGVSGMWLMIRMGNDVGWVFNKYIKRASDFKPLDSMEECIVSGQIGDVQYQYHFYTNGNVSYRMYNTYDHRTTNETYKSFTFGEYLLLINERNEALFNFYYRNGVVVNRFGVVGVKVSN